MELTKKQDIFSARRRATMIRSLRLLIIGAIVAACIGLFADSAWGQCVMCRASISNNHSFIRNFNIGVLVLLVPPVSIFCTIFIIAYRNRKSG